jgi:hypothetical protein
MTAEHESPAALSSRPARWRHLLPPALCVVLAGFLTTAAGVVSLRCSRIYYATSFHHFDSCCHRYRAVEYCQMGPYQSLPAILKQALSEKDGLDLFLRALLAPTTLGHFYGHLVVLLPFLALFLFLLLWYVYQRSGSLLLALAVGAFLFVLPMIYDPVYGISDFWKDNLGTWLLGGAAVSWLLSEGMVRRGWSALSSVLLGMLVMQRTAEAVYAAPLFAVVFLIAAWRCWRGAGWRKALADAAVFVVPASVLTGLVACLQWDSLYDYYFRSAYDYGTFSSVTAYLLHVGGDFARGRAFLGWTLGGCALGLVVLVRRRQQVGELLTSLWWVIALPLGIILTKGHYHHFLTLWFPLVLVLFAALMPRGLRPAWRGPLAVVLLLLAAWCSAKEYRRDVAEVRRQAQDNVDVYRLFDQMADVLVATPAPRRVGFLFDECYGELWSQVYFNRGTWLEAPRYFMSVHDSYYRFNFPGLTPPEIANKILATMERDGGLVFAAFDLNDLFTNPNFSDRSQDRFAVQVIRAQMDHLQKSPHWRAVASVFSIRFGTVVVYEHSPRPLTAMEKWQGAGFAPNDSYYPLIVNGGSGVRVLDYSGYYPAEHFLGEWVRWLPAGKVGAELALYSDAPRTIVFEASAKAGPVRKDTTRTLVVSNGQETSRATIHGEGTVQVRLNLHAGLNRFDLAVEEPADNPPPVLADPRCMMLLLSSASLRCPGPDN